MKIYNVFQVSGMGYYMYMATFEDTDWKNLGVGHV